MKIIDQKELMDHLEDDWELLQDAFELYCDENQKMQSDLRQAIEAEKQFRRDQAARQQMVFRPRFVVRGIAGCGDGVDAPIDWGRHLICN